MEKIFRGIVYNDVIHHHTTTTFKFMDRIKILFGKKVRISSEIYSEHDNAKIIGSTCTTYVERWIKSKQKGGLTDLTNLKQLEETK